MFASRRARSGGGDKPSQWPAHEQALVLVAPLVEVVLVMVVKVVVLSVAVELDDELKPAAKLISLSAVPIWIL